MLSLLGAYFSQVSGYKPVTNEPRSGGQELGASFETGRKKWRHKWNAGLSRDPDLLQGSGCPVQRGTPTLQGQQRLTWHLVQGRQQVLLFLMIAPRKMCVCREWTHQERNQASLLITVTTALTVNKGTWGQVAGQHVMLGQAPLLGLSSRSSHCKLPGGSPEAELAAA